MPESELVTVFERSTARVVPCRRGDEEAKVRSVTLESTGSASTVMVGKVELMGTPLIVAPMDVAVPAVLPVKVAEYVPSPLSVVVPIVPVLVPPE